jgi:hypothetical protein
MIGLIEAHHAAINALCRLYGVLHLDIFGSAATSDDVDHCSRGKGANR